VTSAKTKTPLALLSLSALGVVFGDIGTSPLYTLRTVLTLSGGRPDAPAVLGALSLIVWTLTVVTTVKYVGVAMRIGNDGEGGILALMSLLGTKGRKRPVIVALGLFGAALIYGDGAITPAISVLSALEGLKMTAPVVAPHVLQGALLVLLILFALQPLGTAWIGRTFGPVMALWFICMAVLGIGGILRYPGVVAAVNPLYGLSYLVSHGFSGFLVLGGVFLCVTGAEALYADMGHFGPKPIRLAWGILVFPSLLLNYAGQSAIVLAGARTDRNIFYELCPQAALLPFVGLATLATIIASQSIITGAFSMTREAILLDWMPRLKVRHTSDTGYGQIYVGTVNWLLMAATLGLALIFKKSDNLAAAYGIAVSATMLITTALLFIAMREIWKWSLWASGALAGAFLCVDGAFALANLMKIMDGGYVPLLLAGLVYGVMWVWHRGMSVVHRRLKTKLVPVEAFLADLKARHVPRVPGTAVFLTGTPGDTPPIVLWHVRHNRALHKTVFVLTVDVAEVPRVTGKGRLKIRRKGEGYWHATARIGFMEKPDVPALLKAAQGLGCALDLDDVTYYIGHETVVPGDAGKGLGRWEEALFAWMERNSQHVMDTLKLPADNVVEIGRQIPI
jgi:KUP system potassium uptake protein